MKKGRVNVILSIAAVFFTAIFFTTCSKGGGLDDSESSDYYIKFKIDGVQKLYQSQRMQVDHVYVKSRKKHVLLNLSASKVASIDDDVEQIVIDLDGALEYTNGVWVGGDLVKGTYTNEGDWAKSGYILDPKFFENGSWTFSSNDFFTITYTHLDKKSARGIFSGFIGNGAEKRKITDGEFYLKVQYKEVER